MHLKKIIITLVIILISLIKIDVVNADTYSKVKEDVAEKKAFLLCEYSANNDRNEGIKIYFYPINKLIDKNRTWNNWYVLYKTSKDNYKAIGNHTMGAFKNVFTKDRIYLEYSDKKSYFGEESEATFTCPQYAFLDLDAYNEICFSSTQTGCNDKKFDRGSMNLIKSDESLFVQIDNYIEKQYSNLKSYATDETKAGLNAYGAVLNSDSTIEKIKLNTLAYLKTNYFGNYSSSSSSETCIIGQTQGTTEENFVSSNYKPCVPELVYNYVIDGGGKYDEAIDKGTNDLKKDVEKACESGELTEEQCEESKKNVDDIGEQSKTIFNGTSTNSSSAGDAFERVSEDDFSHNCKDIARVLKLAGVLLIIIKIFIPLIIIIRTTFDMISVVTKGNPDELKKQFSKMMTSVVAGVLIFFVPSIANAIFTLTTDAFSRPTNEADLQICQACIFEPFSKDCENNINN